MWSDTKCALNWIKPDKMVLIFINNRVEEIKNHRNLVLKYVNTKDNPADIATRGTTTTELNDNQLWWKGPKY